MVIGARAVGADPKVAPTSISLSSNHRARPPHASRLPVRDHDVAQHGEMLLIQGYQRGTLALGRRGDQCVREPDAVGLAVMSAIEPALDRDRMIDRDNLENRGEGLQFFSLSTIEDAHI